MSSMTNAVQQIIALADGTPLTLAMDAGRITLAAPGLPPVVLTVPVAGGLVVGPDLRDQLETVTQAQGDAAEYGESVEPSAWFFIAAAFLAAGESGVSF